MSRSRGEDIFRRNIAFIENMSRNISAMRKGIYHEAALNAVKKARKNLTPADIVGLYTAQYGNNQAVTVSPDFAQFCTEFADPGTFNFGWQDSEYGSAAEDTARIAYLQNAYSDRAYKKFSGVFERVTASYFPGFREVCEEVYYDRCNYGILPVSSSTDGSLVSFQKLKSKYELKIALEADVSMNDDSVMRFALLRKGLGSMPASVPELTGAFRYMELSVIPYDGMRIGEFLTSCELLGAYVVSIDSTPTERYGDRLALTLQLDISGANLDALYIFLEGSHLRYNVSGLYDLLS